MWTKELSCSNGEKLPRTTTERKNQVARDSEGMEISDHDTRLCVAIVLVRDRRVSTRGKEMEIRPGHVITSATNPIENVRPRAT